MSKFWSALDAYDRVLFIVGTVFTVFMLFKVLFMMLGGHDTDTNHDGISGDHEGGFDLFGLKLLTLRTISAFVSVGAWCIFIFNQVGLEPWLSTIIGLVIGLGAGVAVALMFAGISKLQNSGNLNLQYSVGKNAEVYLTIPANKSGVGKISVYMEDRYIEVDAMTECEENIKTGTPIKVVKEIGENLLLVDRLV